MSNTLELEPAAICGLIDLPVIGVAVRSGCNLDVLLDGLVVRRPSSTRRVPGSGIGGAACTSTAAAEGIPWIGGWGRGGSSGSSIATATTASSI